VNFANHSFRVVKPTHPFDDDDDDDASCDGSQDEDNECDYDDAASAARPAVIISNIPQSLSKDYLTMFLENTRRSGGGEITDMQFDQNSSTATVTFASPQGDDHFKTFLYFGSKT